MHHELQPTSIENYIILEALGPSYKSNLSAMLISSSIVAEFSCSMRSCMRYILMGMQRFNIEYKKNIRWSYFGVEDLFNIDEFEKNMH